MNEKRLENRVAWHALEVNSVLDDLQTSSEGLFDEEAAKRLQKHGKNRISPQKKRGPLLRFLSQFHNVLIYVLIGAGFVTSYLQHWIDAGVIFGVVLINGLIGFIQEGKAEKALEAIRDFLSLRALVLRDGRKREMSAEEITVGDIVFLQSGDKVPADLRLIKVKELRVDEAALTGESVSVQKNIAPVSKEATIGDHLSMGYSGTLVIYGQATGVVVAVGDNTELVRPQPAAEELYEALKHIGVTSTCCPVVSFQATPLPPSVTKHLLSSEMIIGVSQPAVQYADGFIHQQDLSWPTNSTYLAVGEKTADLMQSLCKKAVQYPKTNDSEGLLALLSPRPLSGRKVTILRGDSGREHLMDNLVNMKADVQYAQTYQRIWHEFSSTQKIQQWQSDRIDTLIVTSFEQLKFFVQQIPSMHKNWLHSLLLMVPSQRIAQLAAQLGFQHIRNLESATNTSIIHAIKGELKRKIV